MATQHSTLVLSLIDNISGPGHKAHAALHGLEQDIHHLKEIGAALGLTIGIEKLVEFGKEALEVRAKQEAALSHIGVIAKATKGEVEHLHHSLVDLALATATNMDDLEKAALRLVQSGKSLHETEDAMKGIAEAAAAGRGSAEKLATLVPRMSKQFKIAGGDLKEAMGAIVAASEGVAEGEDAFNKLVDNLDKAGPLMVRLGWSGIAGLEKYLGYVRTLSRELGGIEPATGVLTDMIAQMESPRMKARFAKAFGKGFDISAEVKAAQRRGEDPFKYYMMLAERAQKMGAPVFITPEQIKAFETLKRNAYDVTKAVHEIKEESHDAVERGLNAHLETTAATLQNLETAWEEFKAEFGKMEVDAGFVKALRELIPLLSETTKIFGDMLRRSDEIGKSFEAIFEKNLSWLERMQRISDWLFGKAQEPPEVPTPRPRPTEEQMERERTRKRPGFMMRKAAADAAEGAAERQEARGPQPTTAEVANTLAEAIAEASDKIAAASEKIGALAAETPGARTLPRPAAYDRKPAAPPAPPVPEMIPLPRPRPTDIQAFEDAGREAAAGFTRGLEDGLAKSQGVVNDHMADILKELSALSSGFAPGRKRAGPGWLAASRRRGSHSDAGSVPIE